MGQLNISISTTDSQDAALQYVTNLFNKGKDPKDQITPQQYAANALVSVLDSYVSQRSNVRTQYGLSLYSGAQPDVKATVDGELGLPADYPTGNE